MPWAKQLAHLQNLLEKLPESTPHRNFDLTRYSFSIEEYGDEISAINHRLKVIFGSRQNIGEIVPISTGARTRHTTFLTISNIVSNQSAVRNSVRMLG